MGFSRQDYCSGLPFSSPRDLSHPGTEPRSPALQAATLPSEPPGKKVQIKYTGAELLETWGGEGRGFLGRASGSGFSPGNPDLTVPLRAGGGGCSRLSQGNPKKGFNWFGSSRGQGRVHEDTGSHHTAPQCSTPGQVMQCHHSPVPCILNKPQCFLPATVELSPSLDMPQEQPLGSAFNQSAPRSFKSPDFYVNARPDW